MKLKHDLLTGSQPHLENRENGENREIRNVREISGNFILDCKNIRKFDYVVDTSINDRM